VIPIKFRHSREETFLGSSIITGRVTGRAVAAERSARKNY